MINFMIYPDLMLFSFMFKDKRYAFRFHIFKDFYEFLTILSKLKYERSQKRMIEIPEEVELR